MPSGYIRIQNNCKQEITTIPLCLCITIGILFCVPIYILTIFNDYIKKYWLYNKKNNTFAVFNNGPKNDTVIQLRTNILRLEMQVLYRDNIIYRLNDDILQLQHSVLNLDINEQ